MCRPDPAAQQFSSVDPLAVLHYPEPLTEHLMRIRTRMAEVHRGSSSVSEPAVGGRKRRYASPMMVVRRQRILEEARAILCEGGDEALTIARLSEQSNVAPRTIYRFFGDKEGVILAAIAHRMEEARAIVAGQKQPYSIETVFHELEWAVSELELNPEFSKVMVSIYFSSTPHVEAAAELSSLARNRFLRWVEKAAKDGLNPSIVDIERLAQEAADAEFLIYHRWAFRGISGSQCLLELKANFLKTAIVALQPRDNEPYVRLLSSVHDALQWLGRNAYAKVGQAGAV